MWNVVYLGDAEQEYLGLPKVERNALIHAIEKLEALGPQLGYPHTSAVQGFAGLRELRPRAGRSPWRALYRRVGDGFVIAAVGPEAEHDQRGFNQAAGRALARLADLEED
jgi:hypothetical protein